MRILVTGGAGFIGSHTCVELLNAGYEVTVIDNLYNSSAKAIDRVKQITGKDLDFVEGDILDKACLDRIFSEQKIGAVIHFAEATFLPFFTVERNQLEPSAALEPSLIISVTTGASAADIHFDTSQASEGRASVF